VDADSFEFQGQLSSFLSHPLLQPQAIQQFMAMPAQQQWSIMQRGSVADARDPTAVLISRISQARSAANFSVGMSTRIPNPADHARPQSDFGGALPSVNRGSLAREEGIAFAGGVQRQQQMSAVPGPKTDPSAFDAGVAFFLAHPLLADMAQRQFVALSFEQQMKIISQGSLHGHKDPSFVLLTRISQVSKAAPSPRSDLFTPTRSQGPSLGGGSIL